MKSVTTSAKWKSAFSNLGCIAPSSHTQVTAFFRGAATGSLEPASGICELAGADPVPLSNAAEAEAEHGGSPAASFSAWGGGGETYKDLAVGHRILTLLW